MSAAPDLTPETLLQHADWVRALARKLVFDPERVDDVVQETWVAALKSPPEKTDRLRGWLASVVRNVARQTGRSETRRRRRELAAPAATPSLATDEVFVRAAQQRDLVDHVFALSATYRDVVLLRYFEGLTPRQIARKRDVPVATVKTRLQRALQQLRARLDEEYGDRKSWCAALLPLAAKGGGVAGTTKLAALAAAAALLAGTWFVTDPRSGRETGGSSEDVAVAPAIVAPSDARTVGASEATDETDVAIAVDAAREAVPSTSAAPARPPGAFPLHGRVIDELGRGLPGVLVRATDDEAIRWSDASETVLVGPSFWLPLSKEERARLRGDEAVLDDFVADEFTDPISAKALILGQEPAIASTRTDGEGRFSLEGRTRTTRARVADSSWCLLGEATTPGATARPLLVVVPAVRLAGRVVDRDGKPVSGAEVTVTCDGQDLVHLDPALEWRRGSQRRWPVESDRDGRFLLERVAGSAAARLGVMRMPYGADPIPVPEHGREELELLIDVPTLLMAALDAGPSVVRGTVRHVDGSPAPRALVCIGDAETRTDTEGRYELSVPDDGWTTLWAIRPGHGYAMVRDAYEESRLAAPGARRLDLGLSTPFRSISGHVVDEDGVGQEGVEVRLVDGTRRGGAARTVEDLAGGRRFGKVVTDADGAFTLEGLLARSYRIRASVDDVVVETPPVPASSVGTVLRVPTATVVPIVRGVVLARDGTQLVGVTVAAGRVRATSDEDGRFTMEQVSTRNDVTARGPGLEPRTWEPSEWAGENELRLVLYRPCRFEVVLPDSDPADGFSLLDESGRELELTVLGAHRVVHRVERADGGFPTCDATDAAAWVVLYRAGQELRRSRVALDARSLNRVAP